MCADKSQAVNLAQDRRKRVILDAARTLFIEKGFEQTSLDMIIARTGGSRRNIYDLFGNKEGLFEAVMKDQLGRILSGTHVPKSAEDGVSIQSQLEAIGTEFLMGLLQPTVLRTLRQFIVAAGERPDLGQQAYAAGPAVLYERLETYFSALVAEGKLDLPDVEVASRALTEMIKGGLELKAMMTGDYEVSTKQIRRQVSKAVLLFLHGALPR
ncbi:TetR/AcrR family transcriptional regulator [Litoreibacter roseus]|uniref:TetR family transcriptional regulator n=1 Tax=Litoreibacter roseus TaxID=2601869 RepID=A0A6N6JJT1_9RHOB|nr:TetR/AcrR family transcriptional regulator [Litoreibacter roseus]GFE66197.1 TetR family transcriptional regulator [Litoreibacter roseus]